MGRNDLSRCAGLTGKVGENAPSPSTPHPEPQATSHPVLWRPCNSKSNTHCAACHLSRSGCSKADEFHTFLEPSQRFPRNPTPHAPHHPRSAGPELAQVQVGPCAESLSLAWPLGSIRVESVSQNSPGSLQSQHEEYPEERCFSPPKRQSGEPTAKPAKAPPPTPP